MYVFSASNKRVSVQLVGKDKIQDKLSRFEELTGASLSYLGVSTPGDPGQIGTAVPSKLVLFSFPWDLCSLDTWFTFMQLFLNLGSLYSWLAVYHITKI